jgi:hypothetical protein
MFTRTLFRKKTDKQLDRPQLAEVTLRKNRFFAMSTRRSFAVILGTLTTMILVNSSDALSCYDCVSVPSGPCGDPFNKESNKNRVSQCFPGYTCWKMTTSSGVKRYCDENISYNGCKSAGTATLCTCDKELCNSALQLHFAPYISLILLVVLLTLN